MFINEYSILFLMDLVSKLDVEERVRKDFSLRCISPDDGKYMEVSENLVRFLSSGAEWLACAKVQNVLLETRVEFGKADKKHIDELNSVMDKLDPLNMSLIEQKVTKHDQLAVLEEIGRFVSAETKALLHPGTTSYDPLDTARSYLFKSAWYEVIRPEISKSIITLCDLSEKSKDILQVGRTHLQDTSPVPLELTLSIYARRLAERIERCDIFFNDLRGKVSGMVGTGAGIEMVIGKDMSLDFELAVLDKLGLKPDYTATQIVQKERLADVGHGLVSLVHVLSDFANDIRMMYSSAIREVTSRDNAKRLGGSSADAMKNNPINWENIGGTEPLVESGMRVLYFMIGSNFQRDLRGSKTARYQPQIMMTETYESFSRLNKILKQLSFNEDKLEENLRSVRKNPSEAMVAILRGERWTHSKYGVGHDFVKKMGIKSKKEGRPLLDVCLGDSEFESLYGILDDDKKAILSGQLEKYIGSSVKRSKINRDFCMEITKRND